MAWISVTIVIIHCGFIFATGTPYVSSIANRNEKRVVLVGSGPLPKYLLQSGYEILPFFGGLRSLNNPSRVRKRIDEKNSQNPKRIFSDKIAPFTSISRKKNIRMKSDIPIVSKPLKLKNRMSATLPVNKNAGLAMKPFSIKNGKVGIPITPPKEMMIKSPQIKVISDEKSSKLPTLIPQISAKKPFLITAIPQNKVRVSSFPPTKIIPTNSPPQVNIAVEKSFIPSQPYQFNVLSGVPSTDRNDPQFVKLINAVKNNQQILKQLPYQPIKSVGNSLKSYSAQPYQFNPSTGLALSDKKDQQWVNNNDNNQQILLSSAPISNTGANILQNSATPPNAVSADMPANFESDFTNVATPLTVVYKKPPVEILKSKHEVYPNPEPYAYGYEMGDGLGTTQYRRESTKGDGVVKGNYGYKDFKGLYRQVNYVADKGGFHAVVKSNEPGIGYADSADVNVLADYSPS